MRVVLALVLAAGLAGTAQALPSIDQVYAAASAGQLAQAQQMLDEVLAAKPDSAKAHFVQAELHAARNKLAEARNELEKAEQLKPGLPFAKPETVKALQARVGLGAAPAQKPAEGGIVVSKGMLTLGTVLAVVFILFMAANRRAQRSPVYAGGMPGGAAGPGQGPGYAPGYGPGYGAGAPGVGSGVLGGLATGAAVGAGIVAGEALMNRVMHGGEHQAFDGAAQPPLAEDTVVSPANFEERLGGSDFGITDGGSWDDGGGDGWS